MIMIGGEKGGQVGRRSLGMVGEAKCDVVDYCAMCESALDPGKSSVCGSDCEIWCLDSVWSVDVCVIDDLFICVSFSMVN